ncbi:MAG: S26 family signal peptidase [Candidatus Altiarchaeota archaeon]|nr:S26 family signal peptidase [Candidatus Altiarchaeota archaeon]
MIEIIKVKGGSMKPLFNSGDFLIILKFGRPKKGDVVVFRHPHTKELLVKKVSSTKDGLDVRGENLSQSTDGRHFGLVKNKEVVGRVWKVIRG